jgi:hypothetical protein
VDTNNLKDGKGYTTLLQRKKKSLRSCRSKCMAIPLKVTQDLRKVPRNLRRMEGDLPVIQGRV